MKRLIGLGSWTYLLNGSIHVVFGALLIHVLDHYGRGYGAGGTLITMQFLGFLIGVLSMPRLIDRLGRRRTLAAAAGAVFVAEGVIGLLPSWYSLYPLALLAGLGFGLAEAAAGTAVLTAAGEKKTSAMNRLEVFFGLGALVMPFLVAFFIYRGLWNGAFFVLSGLALAISIAWARLSFGEHNAFMDHKHAAVRVERAVYTASERPILGWMALFFFLYVGVEVCVIHFMPSMFTETYAWEVGAASLTVTGFWVTMVLGRIAVSWIGDRLHLVKYLIIVCGASAAAMAGLALRAPAWGAYALVLLLGLMFAGIFAIALIYANELLPGRTERTSSLCIAAGGLGGAVLPTPIGWVFERLSAQTALSLLAFTCVLLLLVVGLTKRLHREGLSGS